MDSMEKEEGIPEPEELSGLDRQTRAIEALCTAAQMVLENGGETYRVEETVMRMAKGLGLGQVHVVAFPTSIFVETCGRACVRRISRRGTNMKRLAMVNDISRHAACGGMTIEQVEHALEAVMREPGRSRRVTVLACALACGSVSLMFGGGLGTFCVAFVAGLLIQTVQPLFSHMAMGALFGNFTGGLIASVMAEAVARVVPYGSINATIIAGIMPLLTGLLMTTAVRDTMYGDLVSGLARAVEGLLLAASVALGVYVGLKLMAALGGIL